ncbi:GNAT family N-acetyltransferase [Streptomyces sp. NPDC088725]|uniref:GNAT family N-acetyltransferase n=1 Tax=Streptomyces sp. NPDC088725 TaxID=3365873 RepID=UPI003802DBF0
MNHVIRAVRADEWAEVKELRLLALQDPAAPLAFLATYEEAVKRPDSFWQEQAAGGSGQGLKSRQFIAEAADGSWSASVALLIEEPGYIDFMQHTVERAQGHLVGVYVRPEHRGSGLIKELIAAALDWAWSLEEPELSRVRLYVHEDNARARAAYRKMGFTATGVTVPFEPQPSQQELELVIPRP